MSSEEALARKKKVRAAHRSSATRLMGQADALIGISPIDADELALLQTNLSTKLTTLETLNTEIVELTPEAQLEVVSPKDSETYQICVASFANMLL